MAALVVVVRFPFWFPSVINWDESTFILMGQELLDGRLPYVELWDNKPPLAYVLFALFLAIHPSIVAVRIGGALSVLVAAYLTHRIATRLDRRATGIVAGILVVIFLSIVGSGQATMTETLAVVPLMGATALLVSPRRTPRTMLGLGLLLAAAVLIRTNLAYVALAVTAYPVGRVVRARDRASAVEALAFGLGAVLLPGLIATLYASEGQLDALVTGAIRAPLRYSGSQVDPTSILASSAVLVALAIVVMIPLARRWAAFSDNKRRQIIAVGVMGVATGLSIVLSGPTYSHYRLQVVPFLAIPLAAAVAGGFEIRSRVTVALVLVGLVLTEGLSIPRRYWKLGGTLRRGESVFNDRGYRLARYLRDANPSREPMYLMGDHIAHWLTGTRPITGTVTHPSAIGKEYLLEVMIGPSATTTSELEKILDAKPRFIVTRERLWYLGGKDEAQALLAARLAAWYDPAVTIDGAIVYRLRPRPQR